MDLIQIDENGLHLVFEKTEDFGCKLLHSTIGGAGGGVAYNKDEFLTVARGGLDLSPITQILVEKYIYGWKEIEFEVIRASATATNTFPQAPATA